MPHKKVSNLGRSQLISQLKLRIARHYDPEARTIDRSLVIGIFGEWGSGKSWVLQQLLQHFTSELTEDTRTKQHNFVVPILFNPWRFEAEEHLIIPLLMTVHDELNRLAASETSFKKVAEHFWKSALAFAAAWKFKLGICTFDPAKALDAQKGLYEEENKETVNLNSYYYNFESKLKELSNEGLNFLFLIDDIDRCLPERSVQMLEAIKLFLDVPGCVFVLGVDDEVVERGIRYRYRDYNHNGDDQASTLPLITGMEYLEKIIHLPIRLPLMQESQVRGFLQEKYPDLFLTISDPKEPGTNTPVEGQTSRGNPQAQELLDLFVHAVPPIPRKLIRAAELLSFLCDMRLHFQPDRLMLARLALLQLFAPEVFRHLRRVNPELVRVIAEWQNKDQFSLTKLEKMKEKKKNEEDTEVWLIEERPLITELIKAADNRNNFDPCRVFKGLVIPSELSLTDHIHLVGEKVILSSSLPVPENVAEFADTEAFLKALFSDREATWRKACDDDQLRGKVLANDLFEQIIEKLKENKQLLNNLEWLETLSRRLAPAQLDEFDSAFKLRDRMLLQMKDEQLEIGLRAQAGRTLGLLGDPRKGVTVQTDNPNLPDIDWVKIPAGTFLMGSDAEEAFEYEKPVHEVEVPEFSISRFLVTNAQFGCFVKDGGYSEEKYWQAAGALEWLKEKEEHLFPAFWLARKWKIANHPVVGVSWFEAVAFCQWLGEVTETKVRLPGEEEWEYAARGKDNLIYAWGDTFDSTMGNTSETGLERTSAVGLFPAGKAFGLHDMTGNVWEWTAGRWGEVSQYEHWDASEPGKTTREDLKVQGGRAFRGGSWYDYAEVSRCSVRLWDHPDDRVNGIGFRVVFSLA